MWKNGNGKHVFLGSDPWCGANNSWKLSDNLIQLLNSKGITILNDDFISLPFEGLAS